MKRLLLDTNIYGLLVADDKLVILKERYKHIRTEFPIYGVSVVRKELRATSKEKTLLQRNLRVALLSLYDEFVGAHTLLIDEKELAIMGEKYFQTYKELGGNIGKHELWRDFMIVAAAAKKNLDIVVSHDNSTMLADNSLKAYEIVHGILGLKNPEFYDYLDLRDLLLRPPV